MTNEYSNAEVVRDLSVKDVHSIFLLLIFDFHELFSLFPL